MEEEKPAETPAEEKAPDGDASPEADSSALIAAANKAADRLEAANKQTEQLIAIQQKAQVETTLSGKTDAGVQKLTKEEQDKLNAEKFLEGTGMEEHAFPKLKTDSSYN